MLELYAHDIYGSLVQFCGCGGRVALLSYALQSTPRAECSVLRGMPLISKLLRGTIKTG